MAADAPVPGATLVTVLRHGEVAGRPHVMRGALDEPLSPGGHARVLAAAAGLAAFDRIATSPLRRCREPAAEIAGARGLALEVLPDLAEMRFGAWEGLTGDQAAARDPLAYAAFQALAEHAPAPGGETLAGFRRRVLAAWQAWLADAAGGHRLLLSHAGVMRVLLQSMLELPNDTLFRIALPEAASFQVSLLPGHPAILMRLGDCSPVQ